MRHCLSSIPRKRAKRRCCAVNQDANSAVEERRAVFGVNATHSAWAACTQSDGSVARLRVSGASTILCDRLMGSADCPELNGDSKWEVII